MLSRDALETLRTRLSWIGAICRGDAFAQLRTEELKGEAEKGLENARTDGMKKGIEIWSLNRILRLFGFVVVIGMDDKGTTRIWIETRKAYDARCT